MGDIKDIEDYKQKIQRQAKLRKKTIKAVKEHFNLEDLDLLESELLKDFDKKNNALIEIPQQKMQPIIEQRKIEPKVKSSIVARPIFKNAYERYEWHMQNGCICPEDRIWLAEYIKSDEFKEIYE